LLREHPSLVVMHDAAMRTSVDLYMQTPASYTGANLLDHSTKFRNCELRRSQDLAANELQWPGFPLERRLLDGRLDSPHCLALTSTGHARYENEILASV